MYGFNIFQNEYIKALTSTIYTKTFLAYSPCQGLCAIPRLVKYIKNMGVYHMGSIVSTTLPRYSSIRKARTTGLIKTHFVHLSPVSKQESNIVKLPRAHQSELMFYVCTLQLNSHANTYNFQHHTK